MACDSETIGEFFESIDSFFSKRFRDDVKLRLSATSVRGDADSAETELKFSPRLTVPASGRASGKVKLGLTIDAGQMLLYQRIAVDESGVVSAKIDAEGQELENGLRVKCKGTVQVNTVATPHDDAASAGFMLQHPQGYAGCSARKVSSGESEMHLEAGARMFNGVFGLSHARGSASGHTTSAGLGFFEDGFAAACRLTRNCDVWSSALMGLAHSSRRRDVVAQFRLDLGSRESPSVIEMALENRFRLRLPWSPKATKCTWGVKADTQGKATASLTALVQRVRYGVVVHAEDGFRLFRTGVTIRYE